MSPRIALSRLDLPTPLGPRIATNSPECTVALDVRPDGATAERDGGVTDVDEHAGGQRVSAPGNPDYLAVASASARRSAVRLADLPVLEGGAGRVRVSVIVLTGIPGRLGRVDLRLDVRRGVLAVVDVDLDLSALIWASMVDLSFAVGSPPR